MIWSYSSEKRLVIWRNFRKSLEDKSLVDAARSLAVWWAEIPTVDGFSAPWATDNWPDPWSLISFGPLNHTLTSVAMAYTLWLTVDEKDRERIELTVINDRAKRNVLLVVMIDNQLIINYNTGYLADMNQLVDDVEIIESYQYITFRNRIKA